MDPHDIHAFRDHPRHYQGSKWVYPVLSRRSRGISVGVNISPDKACNFNCVYCQVRRDGPGGPAAAPGADDAAGAEALAEIERELRQTLALVVSGALFAQAPFDAAPAELRRLNDIALSGDGEPTAAPLCLPVVRLATTVAGELAGGGVPVILITNASRLHRAEVREALGLLKAGGGQVWAKLDAGTAAYFRHVNQSGVSFERIIANITAAARLLPIVVQSLFFRYDGQPPPVAEIDAYIARLQEIAAAGGAIRAVQIHTLARPPRDRRVSPLTRDEVDELARRVGAATHLTVERYYGASVSE